MKKYLKVFTVLLFATTTWAQVPQKMSYQGVIRNTNDVLIKNTSIGMQISILQDSPTGAPLFVERHFPTTNNNGLITLEIGTGTLISGNLSTIDWSGDVFYLKTETDINGGANYTITGTSQLLSVPYALHAKTAETVTGTITESDPVFLGSQAANITATHISKLDNLSGTNTGDQDLSALATITALGDSTAQVRNEMPDVSGFLTSETDPSVPSGTQTGEMQYWNGTAWLTITAGNEGQFLTFKNNVPVWVTLAGATTIGPTDIYNPTTGKVWMDRNLGASQVATSSTDVAAYGDSYQWGRGPDGHEKRKSRTTTTLSSSDSPGHGNFITAVLEPFDWRKAQNDNLWQDVNGTNNPCPRGYRLPTEAEWNAERQSWSSNNSAGAFASSLKLPMAGGRSKSDGLVLDVGSLGSYWSGTVSTVDGANSVTLFFDSSNASMIGGTRATGLSVRCIKN